MREPPTCNCIPPPPPHPTVRALQRQYRLIGLLRGSAGSHQRQRFAPAPLVAQPSRRVRIPLRRRGRATRRGRSGWFGSSATLGRLPRKAGIGQGNCTHGSASLEPVVLLCVCVRAPSASGIGGPTGWRWVNSRAASNPHSGCHAAARRGASDTGSRVSRPSSPRPRP